jgi:hypothetical protein
MPEKTGDPIVYFQIRESRKRHKGPITDFLYAYCARVINRIWDLETINHVRYLDLGTSEKKKTSRKSPIEVVSQSPRPAGAPPCDPPVTVKQEAEGDPGVRPMTLRKTKGDLAH